MVAMLLVALAGLATHGGDIERWVDRPSDMRFSTPVLSMIVVMWAAPSIVAVAGWALRSGTLPFVIGACGAALVVWPVTHASPAMVVLAFTLARFAGTHPDASLPLRQRPVLIALGFIIALTALGPPFDAAVALQPDDSERLAVYIDELWSFTLRVVLELAVIASAWGFALGRTWGLVALLLTGPALILAMLFDALTHRLPGWISGCFGAFHPLGELGVYVFLGLIAALLPWLFALGRRLSSLRSPRVRRTLRTPPRTQARARSGTHGTP